MSDPTFENDQYLKRIEEGYVRQFEAQLGIPAEKKEEEKKASLIVRKRLNSDDKYEKKEYQARMEE